MCTVLNVHICVHTKTAKKRRKQGSKEDRKIGREVGSKEDRKEGRKGGKFIESTKQFRRYEENFTDTHIYIIINTNTHI